MLQWNAWRGPRSSGGRHHGRTDGSAAKSSVCRPSRLAQDALPTGYHTRGGRCDQCACSSLTIRCSADVCWTALLGQAGHEVLTASNGAAALELLESQAVDAVVSD